MNPKTFQELTVGDRTSPRGWLRRWLEQQRNGLTSHLEVAGPPFDSKLWACPHLPYRKGASPWWPYEQTAYWVDGLTRCGLALEDPELLRRAQEQIDYVLEHADRDGYLGPKSCKPAMPAGRWPHVIFFRALIAWYQHTGDPRIPLALARHYTESPHNHADHRDVCNIEIMCWLAETLNEPRFAQQAEAIWEAYQNNLPHHDQALARAKIHATGPGSGHGVTYCETVKLGALLYRVTRKQEYLRYTRDGFRQLERHHMLLSGAPSSTEELRGTTSLDAHETCDIVDYSWGAGHLLLAGGDAALGDAIERATFNALPGALTKDFKGLQYFSGANQVILTRNSAHTLAATASAFMSYRPRPGTECCTSNVTRGLPNYVSRMWLRSGDDPVATLYGPGELRFQRSGQPVRITQETAYPFGEQIDFLIEVEQPTAFTLWLRIPDWCRKASLLVNDQRVKTRLEPATFVPVRRTFRRGDRVRLCLPMPLRMQRWPEGGVSMERGPLAFALPIEAVQTRDRDDKHQSNEFPAWDMRPAGPWNYALCLHEDDLERNVTVTHGPPTLDPWSEPTLRLTVPARRVRGWTIRRARMLSTLGADLVDPARNIWRSKEVILRGDFRLTPPLPDPKTLAHRLGKKVEHIELVPYGCTLLRIGVFPDGAVGR